MGEEFDGAKLILFLGSRIVVLRRDARPGIVWPGCLDLPGGGREGAESPEACVLREVREEIGLVLAPDDLGWRARFEAPVRSWLFAAHLEEALRERIVFGGEGRGWMLMEPAAFIAAPDAVPHFRDRVRDYMVRRVQAGQRAISSRIARAAAAGSGAAQTGRPTTM